MTSQTVLVVSPFLADRKQDWDLGYEIIGPRELAAGLDPAVALKIEVIVALGGEPVSKLLMESLPNLTLVACFSTGYEGIDLAYLRTRGVALTTAGGINAHDVADHAMALMLALRHRMLSADRAVREGRWQDRSLRPSLRGQTTGIVGLGRIGQEIAGRAEAFGMRVLWWGPRAKAGVAYRRAVSLGSLARESDVLFISGRATPENSGEIDGEILSLLGPEGFLVNVSRGSLVDEPALLDALENKTIGGAALDVFSEEPANPALWSRYDNVVLSPHIAGFTQEASVGLMSQLCENIRRHFAGEPLMTPVEDII